MNIRFRSCAGQSKAGDSVPTALAAMLLVIVMFAPNAYSQNQPPATQPPANAPAADQAPSAMPSTVQATAEQMATGAAPMRVMVDHSFVIKTSDRVSRVVVTDPAVASVMPLAPGNQILVNGLSAGEVSLLIWDEYGRSRTFDLRVDVDVTACSEEEKRVFPDEQINVTASRSAVVLSGHVSTKDVADRAAAVASAYSGKVINALTSGPVGSQEVLLEVKFAEVDRTAVEQIGFNFFSPGAGNTIGTLTTQQFGGFQVSTTNSTTTTAGGQTTTSTSSTAPTIAISDALNLFLFRSDINLGLIVKALEQKNLLQILAEPSIIAMNGKKAHMLAGGQFPFPIVQPGQGFTAVTISFKNFGVELNFTPEIMPNGNIDLQVNPSVSTLDFTNALTISGFTVPAISTRETNTEFELQDGQSFVIAGLLDNRVTNIESKFPGLGDIPILGEFFRSKSAQKSKTELMVLCTVRKVEAGAIPPPLPTQPVPFLDKNRFDATKPPHGK
jgi:pilus assembly protein CpaC